MPSRSMENVLKTIQEGGVVILPTDTILGISCDATNEEAVQRLIDIKGRDESKSFIILVADDGMLQRHVKEVPEVAWDLIDASMEPLTIIYPQAVGLAKGVAASDGSIGIRIAPPGPIQKLLHRLRRPIVSTSTNLSGQPPAMSADELDPLVLEQVDHIVNSPPASGNKPSSIIRIGINGEVDIIRE